ncbi:citrate synthase, putative [Eimeria maxima]|uniref:Citrate synthase, putative n=1 Tax=Eimeria maxima TaxID=5804 RepID=U6M0P9_EIMMA|nr:citrate synthase, putative [Eimeria maxima]CDJ57561.1 citrate synthase, putative [Eimeria maxima]
MLGALKGHLAPAIISSEDNDSQQSLKIIDERTGREYRVPIKHNTIEAKKLAEIKTLEGLPLRCYDPGLMHTCIGSSKICFIDGDKGILRHLEGLNFVEPKEGLGLVENFLYMVDKQHHDPVVVRAL